MTNNSLDKLPYIPAIFSRAINNYISRKQHTEAIFTLNRNRIYILPTKAGWFYLATIFIVLLGAINYNNSMAYVLCFLLGSIGFLAMLHTHQTINHISFTTHKPENCYKNNQACFPVVAQSESGKQHYAINIESDETDNATVINISHGNIAYFNIYAKASNRGVLSIPRFKISTEYPLGLFYAWAPVSLQSHCLVYPEIIEVEDNLFSGKLESDKSTNHTSGNDEVYGVREYQRGDSLKSIAWKATAKTGELYTKQTESNQGNGYIFSLNDLPDSYDLEKKLSILCSLIKKTYEQGFSFSLELPGSSTSFNNSAPHFQHCLSELALFQANR